MPALNIPDAITATNRAFMAAFEKGDAAAAAETYSAEGQILPPHQEPMTGHDAIRAFWQGAMDMGVKRVLLETVEFSQMGEIAVEIGRYTLSGSEMPVLDSGKYAVVWKREGDAWRLHRDIWNSSRPLA
jgi:ketosteroid isomerase-like protein